MEPNNTFSFDPNRTDNVKKTFEDGNGKNSVLIYGDDAPINMPEGNIKLANRPAGKKLVKTNKNIGPGANGFAGVALLAGIIAFAGIVIAYLALKY